MAPKPIFSSYLSFQFLRHIGMPSSQLIHDGGEIFSEVTLLRPVLVHLSNFNSLRLFSNSIQGKSGS